MTAQPQPNTASHDVALIDLYKANAEKAHQAVSEECTHLNYALGQEALADVVAWTQTTRYLLEFSFQTQSFETLQQGAPYFESAASTIPIIGPLVAERLKVGRTRSDIRRLQDVLEKHPEAALDDPETMEVDLLTTRNGHNHSNNHGVDPEAGFWKGLGSDWWESVTNTHWIARDTLKAVFDGCSRPFVAWREMKLAQQPEFQFSRLMKASDGFQAAMCLEINSDESTICYDKESLEQEDAFHKKERRSTLMYLGTSGLGTLAASNFICNEIEQAVHVVVPQNDPTPLPPIEATPADSIVVTGSMIASVLSHVIPASLTLSPLKNMANSFSEHMQYYAKINRRLNLMDFVRTYGQDDKTAPSESPTPEPAA